MDDFTYHDALWDSLDSYRTDTVTGGPESLGVKRVDPSFADGPLEPLCIPSAGNSSQSGPALQWSHYVIYQGPDEKMIANIFIRPGQIGCLRGHQDRHQPVVSHSGCDLPFCQHPLVLSAAEHTEHLPPKESLLPPNVWLQQVPSGDDEVSNIGYTVAQYDIPAGTEPGADFGPGTGQGCPSVLHSVASQIDRVSLQQAPILIGRSSVSPSQNPTLLDVGSTGIPWPHGSPGGVSSLYILNSGVESIGSVHPPPLSSPGGLDRTRTEYRPSHAYPPRHGTEYVLLHCDTGQLTDATVASAPEDPTSPSLDVMSPSPARSGSCCHGSEGSEVSSSSRSPLGVLSTPLETTIFARSGSNPTHSGDNSDQACNRECVWDFRMQSIEPRKRRQSSATEKAETNAMRVRGACEKCRRAKRKVPMLSTPVF